MITTNGPWGSETDPTDPSGHTWRRFYYDGQLVGMRCDTCRRDPLEVLADDCMLRPCGGTVSGIMKGFNL